MAYSSAGLGKIAGSNGWTVWVYESDDTLSTIMADGYFDTAATMLRAGDKIIIRASDAYWEDVVWSVTATEGSEDVAIGIQADDAAVDDTDAVYRVGSERMRWDGAVFRYCTAATDCAATDWATLTDPSAIVPLDTDVAASILVGAPVGICMAALDASDENTGWVCVKGAGIDGNSATTMTAGVRLGATSTAGQVDDLASAETGIVKSAMLTAAPSNNVGKYTLAYPYIDTDLDT